MTIPEAFQIAVQHHQAGRLAQAERIYCQILAVQPNDAKALRLRGVIAQQMGRHELAVNWIRQSIAANPNNPAAYSNLGEIYRATGRLDEAITSFRRALELQPDHAQAYNNLGAALAAQGSLDEAITAYRKALQGSPDFVEALNNLGVALHETGRFDEAIDACRRAIDIQPDQAAAWYNLGNALKSEGRFEECIGAYRRALLLMPNYAKALNNLGVALKEQGALDEAVASYRKALQIKPDFLEAHTNLGAALVRQGRHDEAVSVYRRALEVDADFPETHVNLGNALMDQGDLDGALAAYRRALQIKPDNASAHSNLVFALHFHPGQNASTISEEHQRWNRQFRDPLKQPVLSHANDPTVARPLRVGCVSPDFRDHAVGRFALPLLEQHDRERFEIICYSELARPDWMTERLRRLAGKWRDTIGVSDARLAQMIREDGVDILVDLALHTAGNRLPMFTLRPAPVQVTWLGYPGSTGVPDIGYRLTDAQMDPPEAEPEWSAEEPVRLPDCWCCYQPAGEIPEINALPALSAKGVTFGSLSNFAKVNQGVLALWARTLGAVDGSSLLMSCPEGRTRERVRAFFSARGIGTERVDFVGPLSHWDYLRHYQKMDLGLDPFPCNGMTTTCDALWMGVPVLTLPGEMPVSRAGLSLLSTIGLGELAASSEEDYVRLAVEWAGNLPRLANLRATLRARMQASPLMDAPQFARNVEAAYQKMWQQWKGGRMKVEV